MRSCTPEEENWLTRQQLHLITAGAALAVFKDAIDQGYGEEDLSAVVKSSRKLSAPQAR